MIEQKLEHIENKLNLFPDPPKTRMFSIGERVQVGGLKEPHIIEVLYDSKIYKIEYIDVNTNYGNPIETPGETRYVNWLSVLPHRTPEEDNALEQFTQEEDIFLRQYTYAMSGLLLTMYTYPINFNPPYQRDYVWDVKEKRELLDSIFDNIDIGKIILRHLPFSEYERTGYGFEVIDGKQRLLTIKSFYEDGFKYKGKLYSQLSNTDRHQINECHISYGEINNATDEQVLKLFIKLNTGGKDMSKQQILHAKKLLKEKK